MAFSTTSTHMIFFISSMIIAASFIGIVSQAVLNVSNGIEDRQEILSQQLGTEIEIINDPGNVPNNPVVIYIKNTGTRNVEEEFITVSITGGSTHVFVTNEDANYSLLDGGDYLKPKRVMSVSIDTTLPSGDYDVRVVTGIGVYDDMAFTID